MLKLRGGIAHIAGRLMTGWVQPGTAAARLGLEFVADGQPLGGTIAELPPESTDGRLVFEFMLPRRLLDGQTHELAARSPEGEVVLENNIHILGAQTAPEVTGWLEKISDDGRVLGWAWYPQQPQARVEVELLVDGFVAGSAMAGLFRADVADAGAGDGCYGFSWPLPFSVLQMARDVTISARDKISGKELPKPLIFRQQAVVDAYARMNELENDIRLLQGTIAALNARNKHEAQASTELFKIVGDFFIDLAAASGTGAPLAGLRSAQSAVVDLTSSLETFVFTPCAAPEFSVFVEAGVDVATTYASLRALHETLGEAPAEVFLIDDGHCQDAALLALVAQNLRYARLPGGAAARRNHALRLAKGAVAVFIAAGVLPVAGWASALAGFKAQAGLVALVAPLRDEHGALLRAGGAPKTAEEVDMVASAMFALSRNAWELQGGFDETYEGSAGALAAFFLRAWAGGGAVADAPEFAGIVQVPLFTRDAQAVRRDAEDARRLRMASEQMRVVAQAPEI